MRLGIGTGCLTLVDVGIPCTIVAKHTISWLTHDRTLYIRLFAVLRPALSYVRAWEIFVADTLPVRATKFSPLGSVFFNYSTYAFMARLIPRGK